MASKGLLEGNEDVKPRLKKLPQGMIKGFSPNRAFRTLQEVLTTWYSHSLAYVTFSSLKPFLPSSMTTDDRKDLESGFSPSPAEQVPQHVENRGQKASPPPRRLANPAPLGLLSFATGIFLISSFGVHARGIQTPNVMISVLIFFGGICQYIVGIMEFVSGNTFGATVFSSYAAFNVSYALIYLPGSGIIAAYTNETGELSPDFAQSLALYVWAWFILTVIYTVAAWRSTWVLFLDLLALDFCLLLLAVGFMTGQQSFSTAGYAFGYVVAALSCEYPLISPSCTLQPLVRVLTDGRQTGRVAQGCIVKT